MTATPRSNRTRLVGFGLLVATFLVGALSGAAVERVLSADEPDAPTRAEREDDGRRRSYVIHHVEMAPEQRAAIDGILKQRSARMRSVWQEVEPRLDAITDSARIEIMQVLTPAQRAEYEGKLEARRARRGDRRDRSPSSDSGSK
ncbi:MAG TPA: hypothetical protein VMM12_12440 [Longimicrobiales bacterium]|nr:hypothetical protein [Longimicrobiales bacterium]